MYGFGGASKSRRDEYLYRRDEYIDRPGAGMSPLVMYNVRSLKGDVGVVCMLRVVSSIYYTPLRVSARDPRCARPARFEYAYVCVCVCVSVCVCVCVRVCVCVYVLTYSGCLRRPRGCVRLILFSANFGVCLTLSA